MIVVDLRAPGMEALVFNLGFPLRTALPHADKGLIVRTVVHHGYRTQDGLTSGGYDSGLLDRAEPPPPGGGKARHVVFVGDNHAAIPQIALMLQASGKATIVSPEPLHDTTYWMRTQDIELPYSLVAHIRLEEVTLRPLPAKHHRDAASGPPARWVDRGRHKPRERLLRRPFFVRRNRSGQRSSRLHPERRERGQSLAGVCGDGREWPPARAAGARRAYLLAPPVIPIP